MAEPITTARAVGHKQVVMRRLGSGSRGERPIMLAVAGDSAAGKTTLVRGLVDAIDAHRIDSICVDDYHRYDRTERAGLPFTALDPQCNYINIMEQHLQLLAMGEPILKPVYNHHDGTLDRPVLVEPGQYVLVEGLLPLCSRLSRACFDLSVYLDPPEPIRRTWKVKRDTRDRGYTEEQVLGEMDRREADSAAFIRPQRQWADIVVRFAPIEERHESPSTPKLSATVLLRPTVAHPDLSAILTEDTREAVHLKLVRDVDGKPVDALHIHAYASRESTHRVETAIWSSLGLDEQVPESLGTIEPGVRSGPLAIVQLILLFHLVQAGQLQGRDLDNHALTALVRP